METRLSDEAWRLLGPKLSKQGSMGRPRCDERQCLEAILYVLINGIRWNDLPALYGHYSTAWRRLQCWALDGSLLRVWRHLLMLLDVQGKLDWKHCALDGSYVKAKKGAAKSGAAARG